MEQTEVCSILLFLDLTRCHLLYALICKEAATEVNTEKQYKKINIGKYDKQDFVDIVYCTVINEEAHRAYYLKHKVDCKDGKRYRRDR